MKSLRKTETPIFYLEYVFFCLQKQLFIALLHWLLMHVLPYSYVEKIDCLYVN